MAGTIRIENGNVIFELHGIDEIFAIKRSISVPLKHVSSVSTDKVPWNPFSQLKVGGTSLPGVIKDGRFLDLAQGLMFFEMHDTDKCVTVALDHEKYKKIIFEVDDKEAAARAIRDALGQRGS